MRGLVLAGGSGTRLRPLTHTGAKQLVPVANRPILFYVIDCLVSAGIKEVGIVVSPETASEIRRSVGDGSQWDVDVTYIVQDRPEGLAHAVLISRDFIGDDDFCLFLGDNLVGDMMLGTAIRFEATKDASASLLLKSVPDPRAYGVAEVDARGRVVGLTEKPSHPKSDLALVGIYFFRKEIFEAIGRIKPSKRGELEITDAIQVLIDDGSRVDFSVLDSWWLDTGKKDDLLLANDTVLDEWTRRSILGDVDAVSTVTGRVLLESGASVVRSTVRGPVVVGKGTSIVDSHVGPYTSIGAGSRVENSRLEHSILMEGVEVHGANLTDSVLGRRVVVRPSSDRGSASRLMVGDDSRVEV